MRLDCMIQFFSQTSPESFSQMDPRSSKDRECTASLSNLLQWLSVFKFVFELELHLFQIHLAPALLWAIQIPQLKNYIAEVAKVKRIIRAKVWFPYEEK